MWCLYEDISSGGCKGIPPGMRKHRLEQNLVTLSLVFPSSLQSVVWGFWTVVLGTVELLSMKLCDLSNPFYTFQFHGI